MKNNRRIVILPEGLVYFIDQNRGALSRAQFIEHHLNFDTENGIESQEKSDYVVRAEFEELKRQIREIKSLLQRKQVGRYMISLPEETVRKIDDHQGQASRAEFIRKCIEFSLEKAEEEGLQSTSSASSPYLSETSFQSREVSTNSQCLSETSFQSREVSTNSQNLSETSSLSEEASESNRAYLREAPFHWKLWIAAILIYGIGDLAFTFASLYHGGIELNPIVRYLAPGNPFILIPIKVSVLSALFLLSYFLNSKEIRFVIPLMALLCGTGLILHNLIVILEII